MRHARNQPSLFGTSHTSREQQDEIPLNVTVEEQDKPRLRSRLVRLQEEMGVEWRSYGWMKEHGGDGFGQRLYDLSQAGFPFEKERDPDNRQFYRYRLVPTLTNGMM